MGVGRVKGDVLVRQLVEGGGWMLIGGKLERGPRGGASERLMRNDMPDSITEEHFFSLSCELFPHVRVEWHPNLALFRPSMSKNPALGVFHQSLYLRQDSPLIPSLNLPSDFSFADTPLITNIRSVPPHPPSSIPDHA